MVINKVVLAGCCSLLLALSGCSRQQSDWEKTRAANTTDAYELFLKKYPGGEFAAQAQARVKELYEERDWQKARDTDTADSYQAFLKQYPEGKQTEEARIRLENFTLAAAPPTQSTNDAAEPPAGVMAPAPGSAMMSATPKATPKAPPIKAHAAPQVPSGDAGPYGVQLGAFKSSAAAANKRWSELAQKYPQLLGGLSPKVAPKQSADGTLYRLQVANLSEKHARAICKSLQASSQPCVLVPPRLIASFSDNSCHISRGKPRVSGCLHE